jgi:aryl-alcohol dehydrogenase-like predicted oxidoreductase
VLPAPRPAGVGIIARVPLASGLLSGTYDESTQFAADDHRTYNRHGEAFDVGETFGGVPFDVGCGRGARGRAATPAGATTAQLALRWVIDQPGVTTVIPGARNAGQVRANVAAARAGATPAEVLESLRRVYDDHVRAHVHDRW